MTKNKMIVKGLRMYTIIPILQLLLLFTYGKRNEPKLECLNDYDSEMKCSLTSYQNFSCYDYTLNLTYQDESFSCRFENINDRPCECTFYISYGFVLKEYFAAILFLKEKHVLEIQNRIENTIKFKNPVIKSVNRTEHGDYIVYFNTTYPVYTSVILELSYGIKGMEFQTVDVAQRSTSYTILGKKLQPNSKYTVKARTKNETLLGKISDFSEPHEFRTSTNIQSDLKMIIPFLCIILIIGILTIYFFYVKILKVWWDNIPTPKIPANFVKQVPILQSFKRDFVPVHFDSAIMEHREKKWIPFYQTDVSRQNSDHNFGQEGNSGQVIYAQTGYEIAEGNNSQCDSQQMAICNKVYENLNRNETSVATQKECNGNSGLDNKAYFNKSCISASPNKPEIQLTSYGNQSENCITNLVNNRTPLIPTDFEYRSCTSCSGSVNTSLSQVMPNNDIFVVPEYQSVDEVNDSNKPKADSSQGQGVISSHNDINLIITTQICKKNPQNASTDCHAIIPLVTGYKDFQSLCQKSKKNVSQTECLGDLEKRNFLLNNHHGSAVNVSSQIEIDSNYHRV